MTERQAPLKDSCAIQLRTFPELPQFNILGFPCIEAAGHLRL
jgi:hypothetical protein